MVAGDVGETCAEVSSAKVEVSSTSVVEDVESATALDVDAAVDSGTGVLVTSSTVVGTAVVDAGRVVVATTSWVVGLSGFEVVSEVVSEPGSVHSPHASLQYSSIYLGFLWHQPSTAHLEQKLFLADHKD